jgi:hypothetical protein
MSNDTDNLDILYKELDGLRQMQRGLQSSIHQAVFAFALATGGVAAAYPAIKEDMRPTALFVLTQIEFALGVLVLGLLAHHNVATGCSIAIERKINRLAKSNVAIFEGHLAAHFYRTSNGAFWFAKYTASRHRCRPPRRPVRPGCRAPPRSADLLGHLADSPGPVANVAVAFPEPPCYRTKLTGRGCAGAGRLGDG